MWSMLASEVSEHRVYTITSEKSNERGCRDGKLVKIRVTIKALSPVQW